jgi:enoyl-CoA hydratase
VNDVSIEDHDGVALIAIDRPPANAMNVDLLEQIVAAVTEVDHARPDAVVIAGRPGFFSAGADLKAIPTYGPDEQRASVRLINEMALGVYALPCPAVAAITGHAIAGGFVLAMCTDMRVASNAGKYGVTEVKVGVPYPQAAIGALKAELSPSSARVLVLGNQLYDADECKRLGAFDEVVEPDAVVPRALELAAEMAAMPGDVYSLTKRELRADTTNRLREWAASDPLLDRWVS